MFGGKLPGLFASASVPETTQEPFVVAASIANDTFDSFVGEMKDHFKKRLPLLADAGGLPDVPTTPGSENIKVLAKGIYIYNASAGVNERLMNYTAEANA